MFWQFGPCCLWKLQNAVVWYITQAIIRLFGRGHDLSILVFLTETVMIISSDRCCRGWQGTVMCSSTTQGRHLRHLLSTFHHCNLTPPPPPSVQDIRRKQFSRVSIVCSLHCVDHQSKDTDGPPRKNWLSPSYSFANQAYDMHWICVCILDGFESI